MPLFSNPNNFFNLNFYSDGFTHSLALLQKWLHPSSNG